jgi:hypothetical protein
MVRSTRPFSVVLSCSADKKWNIPQQEPPSRVPPFSAFRVMLVALEESPPAGHLTDETDYCRPGIADYLFELAAKLSRETGFP